MKGDLKFNIALIHLVKDNPILYNTSHPKYRELRERQKCWVKIADELNADVNAVKKRFRAIKDRFVRERRLGTRNWALFGQMLWISDFVGNEHRQNFLRKIRKRTQDRDVCKVVKEEIADPLSDSSSRDTPGIPDVPEPWNAREIFAVPIENGHHDRKEISTLNTKRKRNESNEDLNESNDLSDSPSKIFENDEDTLFVLSLAPALKRMSRITKNQVKIKLLEIISEHDNDDDVSPN